jgi:hypothetical protein
MNRILFSMKMRLGYDTTEEILMFFPILEKIQLRMLLFTPALENNCTKEAYI